MTNDALFDTAEYKVTGPNLAERFGVPPFSVIQMDSQRWYDRKNNWLQLGIQSELGRDVNAYNMDKWAGEKGAAQMAGGNVSVFDPALTELVYSWWVPSGGKVYDPFAGGSVRGIVAAALGLQYKGIELRYEQVLANAEQWRSIGAQIEHAVPPRWHGGDSLDAPTILGDETFDFVFSCPPYFNLEKYSDDPQDLSNMTWDQFVKNYYAIVHDSVSRLKENRFAAFVVGNFRDKHGTLISLEALTIDAFQQAGADFYNDIILVTPVGTLPVRTASKNAGFEKTRKIGRRHQYLLVFVKGSAKEAVEACAEISMN